MQPSTVSWAAISTGDLSVLARSTICTWPSRRAGNANKEFSLSGHNTHRPAAQWAHITALRQLLSSQMILIGDMQNSWGSFYSNTSEGWIGTISTIKTVYVLHCIIGHSYHNRPPSEDTQDRTVITIRYSKIFTPRSVHISNNWLDKSNKHKEIQ